MSRRVVLASNNAGKLRELQRLLSGAGIEVVTQANLGVEDIEETGLSFVENAILKARNAAAHTGLPAIGDDSGLEVDALNGAPGIYSARYAGKPANDANNNKKLLHALRDTPEAQRGARFRCVLVYMRHGDDPMPVVCSGTWDGRILTAAQGENGFGYDPLFYVPTHRCSAAQLDAATKNELSHRGQALRALLDRFRAKN